MDVPATQKLLFILNPSSGTGGTDWPAAIIDYCGTRNIPYLLHTLQKPFDVADVKSIIQQSSPGRVIAVGGDGTVKLLAGCLLHSEIPLGILPAGSANGMARELGIPNDAVKALEIAERGYPMQIHLVRINNELCIHLGDLGFNAFMVKHFETAEGRGMWGYLKASWKALMKQPQMELTLQTEGKTIHSSATMVVLANGTRYGTGAQINPVGRLDDRLFEVIILKKISLAELYKMMVSHAPYNTSKIEIFQTSELSIHSEKRVHFQVDGEYLGRVNDISAQLVPDAIRVILPRDS